MLKIDIFEVKFLTKLHEVFGEDINGNTFRRMLLSIKAKQGGYTFQTVIQKLTPDQYDSLSDHNVPKK